MRLKTVLRFFRNYCVLFVLLFITMIFVYEHFNIVLRDYECKNYTEIVKSNLNELNNEINAVIKFSYITNKDSRYRSLFCKDVVGSQIPVSGYSLLNQVQHDFSYVFGTLSLIKDVGLYIDPTTTITNKRSVVNYPYDFYGTFYTHGNLTSDEWYSLLKENLPSGFIPSSSITSTDFGTYPGITFVCSWPSNHVRSYNGIVYATFDENDLVKLLLPDELMGKGYITLTYSSNEVETCLFNNVYTKDSTSVITYNMGNFTIEVGIPDSIIDGHLVSVKRVFISVAVGIVLIFLLVSMVLAIFDSKPLLNVLGLINEHENSVSPKASSAKSLLNSPNEYDFIASRFTDIYAQVTEQQRYIAYQLFSKTLSIGLPTNEQETEFRKTFPDFPDHFKLICIRQNDSELVSAHDFAILAMAYLDTLSDSYSHCQLIDDKLICVLINADLSISVTPEIIRDGLADQTDADFSVFVSEECNGFAELTLAYSQIKNLILTSQSGARDNYHSILVYNRNLMQLNQSQLDFGLLDQFYSVLQAGKADAAISILHTHIHNISTGCFIDETFLKQLYYNYRYILIRVKLDNYNDMTDVVIPQYNEKWNLETLSDCLAECITVLCERISTRLKENQDNMIEDILSFIKENISDPELYSQMIVTQFNISETTMQKVIRKATNKSFYEYVEMLRMELAKDKLINSDEAITDICINCGYSSSNAFYKAFKRNFGMAPGAYRTLKKSN